ncbi:ferrous iron transporter B [Anaerovorax sp. IOR16]|uniref:ferrous iron transporter B n=1 Tax=Anaerovorax sp. IOR16 TaxID=2773458 RepID=UPI0019D0DFF4|nr:ferrous iron transporter B [Anaerovorax sp. IOR16]
MKEKPLLILVGNPNVGKSVLFQYLTGIYAEVSNFPGTTVEVTEGTFEQFRVLDVPGVFGLSSDNDEERVTLDAVLQADMIVNVLDGTQLHRDLFLTLQLIDLGKPMILLVNMMDDVQKKHIYIDFEALEKTLGVPIVAVSGRKGSGILQMKHQILEGGSIGQPFVPYSWKDHFFNSPSYNEEANRFRRKEVNRLLSNYLIQKNKASGLGLLLLHPFFGFLFLIFILSVIYFIIGKVLAQEVINFTEDFLMGTCYFNWITGLLNPCFSDDSFISCLLLGEYGLLTMVPIYLFGLLLPLVAGFYFILSLLEDCGILCRVAVLMDRWFSKFGLNGKAIIPMLLGFGCVTMALITTRILGTKRERLIASALLCIGIPCSAQFAILLAISSQLTFQSLLIYLGTVFSLFFFVGFFLNHLLPGTSSELFLILPPLRTPVFLNLIKKTAQKTNHFLHDAGVMFVLGSILLSLLSYFNGFALLYQSLEPLTTSVLGLPPQTAGLFLMCMIKKDLGAAHLYSMVSDGLLSEPQIVIVLTIVTLFVPCFASLAVLIKEQSPLQSMLIWLSSIFLSFSTGAILAQVLL